MMYKQLDGRGQLNGASQLEGRMQMCDEGWLRYPEPMDNGVDAVDSEMTTKSVVKERMVDKSLVKEWIVKNRTANRVYTIFLLAVIFIAVWRYTGEIEIPENVEYGSSPEQAQH